MGCEQVKEDKNRNTEDFMIQFFGLVILILDTAN